MEYTQFGNTEMNVSKITLGCWAIGGGKEWGNKLDDKIYIETIRSAIEGGINLIDTAAGYGGGHSEKLVKNSLEGQRDKVYISTKNSSRAIRKGSGEAAIAKNLERLGTDYIDLYFLHWPDPDIPIEENMEELLTLKEKKLIRYIGLSNITMKHLERALKVGWVDAIQPCYNLFWRHVEKDLIPFCKQKGIGIITYSSIAQGLLTGKFTKDWKFDESDQRPKVVPLFMGETFEKAIDAASRITNIAKKYGKTTTQAAINWLISQDAVSSAIVGAKTPEQIKENLGATNWKLSEEDHKNIGEIGMEVAKRVMDWDTMYAKNDKRLELRD